MLVYLNGKYIDADRAVVSVWDGGFLYGDGIYTTLRLYAGEPLDLAAHFQRLTNHAATLDLPLVKTEVEFREIARHLARENDLTGTDGRMRITITRGGGPDTPLPLSHLETIEPTVLVTLTGLGEEHDRWRKEGISVITLDASFARGNFPELKTLNSLATIRALRRATAAGCQEAILTDPAGCLLEGAISNLFLVSSGNLLTPACSGGFLPGRTRERILEAYRTRCCMCRLGHRELLDAAHIIPDSEPHGAPVVPNGLSLCKLHHAAFDQHFLGVRPDLKIEIREDLLREKDGPMLIHGLQGFQGRRIHVPGARRLRPAKELLEERYEQFRRAV